MTQGPRILGTHGTVRGLPSLIRYIRDPLGQMRSTAREHGDVLHFRAPGFKIVQLTWPAHIDQILGPGADVVKGTLTRSTSDVLGQGLITSEGELWRTHRRLASPAFRPGAVRPHAAAVAELAAAVQLPTGRIDLLPPLMDVTIAVVSRLLFGPDVRVDSRAVADRIAIYMHAFFIDMFRQGRLFPKRVPMPWRRRRKAAIAFLRGLAAEKIRERAALGPGTDVVWQLMEAGLDEKGLQDEVLTMFTAGHETTALTVGFALFLLAQRPDLQDELVGALAPYRPGEPAPVPLLDGVIRESMRLYPPVYILGREVQSDCEIGGVPIPRGTRVITPQWAVHVDERFYRRPHAFRPERWFDGETDDLPRGAYFPFGAGPRVCIGQHFAMLEMAVLLHSLLSRWQFRPAPGYRLEIEPSVTLRPRGSLEVIATPRT